MPDRLASPPAPAAPPKVGDAPSDERRLDVLRHRVIPTYEAEAENLTSDDLVRRLFELVEVP